MLGTPVTTYKDIVSLKLSSMPASALPKNALGVRADPKGQVLLTPHTPKPHQNLTHIQPYQKRRFPQPSSIQQHALTEAEVMQLVEGVLASFRARDTQV